MLATERSIYKQALRSCYFLARNTIAGDAIVDFRDVAKCMLQQQLQSLLHSDLSLKLCHVIGRRNSRNHFHVAEMVKTTPICQDKLSTLVPRINGEESLK